MSILDALAASAAARVEAAKRTLSVERIRALAMETEKGDFRFEKAVAGKGITLICEVKKASPSKGVISPDFPYLEIAGDYAAGGADCLSVLTEPTRFLGSDAIFREVRRTVSCPMLRKDFTVDEYQIYEAKRMGADAVLLIAALLDTETLSRYTELCDTLGMSALVETHDEAEIRSALNAGARMIGVNNRNLHDFSVDLSGAERLRAMIPSDVLFVAESGVSSVEDAARLAAAGADALLIGEFLMRSPDRRGLLSDLRAACGGRCV